MKKGQTIYCTAPECKEKIKWGTGKWARTWMRVWIEKDGAAYDVCSRDCADKLKKGKAENIVI